MGRPKQKGRFTESPLHLNFIIPQKSRSGQIGHFDYQRWTDEQWRESRLLRRFAPRKDTLALVIASEAKQPCCSLNQAKAHWPSLLRHPEFISGSRYERRNEMPKQVRHDAKNRVSVAQAKACGYRSVALDLLCLKTLESRESACIDHILI